MPLIRTYLALALAAVFWVPTSTSQNHPARDGALRGRRVAQHHCSDRGAADLCAAAGTALDPPLEVVAVAGLTGVVGFNVFFFLALQTTSAVNASLIMALSPLLTVIVAFFVLGDRPTLLQLIALPVSLGGVTVVVLGAGEQAATCWRRADVHGEPAVGPLQRGRAQEHAARRERHRQHPRDHDRGQHRVDAFLGGCRHGPSSARPRTGVFLLLLSLGGGLIAYYLWNAGVRKIGAGRHRCSSTWCRWRRC